jgi:CubicO group peptidase (beta-lactamase class C family)
MLKKSHHIVLGGLLAVLLLSPTLQARLSTDRLLQVDAILSAQVDAGKIAGAVVQITHRGKVVKSSVVGWQDREAEIPLAANTIFRIASQTKAIVSTAVMILQERGALVISDPIGKYLPEYMQTTVAVAGEDGSYDIQPANRPITIRDLLTHTAGIGYGGGAAAELWQAAEIQGWYFAHRAEPIRETVRRIAALPFDAQPGERFVYGYNTDILGVLIEVASGQDLATFLQDNLFDPLGMTDTHFYLPKDKVARLAVVYGIDKDGKLARAPNESNMLGQGAYVEGPRRSYSGGAGLLSTAADYSRFLETMRRGGVFGKVRILGRKTVELMTVNHLNGIAFNPGMGFGLGFSIVEDLGAQGAIGSEGTFAWGGAYHTTYWVDPSEELVVSYMTQLRPATGADDTAKLRAAIYAALE